MVRKSTLRFPWWCPRILSGAFSPATWSYSLLKSVVALFYRKQSKDHTCHQQLSDRPDLFRQFVSIPSFLHSLLHTANWCFPSSSKKTIKDGMQFPFPFYKQKCPCKYVPKSVESSLHIHGSIFPILHLFKAQNVQISVSSHK